MTTRSTPLSQATAVAILGVCLGSSPHVAMAALDGGVIGGELAVTIWDPVNKGSYTKDLGIKLGDFFIQGQPDAGYQQFWAIDSSDPAFAALLALGSTPSSLLWAVTGVNATGVGSDPGDAEAFITLRQGPTQGVVNPTYTQLFNHAQSDAATAIGNFQINFVNAINDPTGNTNNHQNASGNTQDFAYNGSSFSTSGQKGYFGDNGNYELSSGFFLSNPNQSISNQVGKSSWFYKISDGVRDSGDYDLSQPITVDEFDNLHHDGYWGLAIDPSTGKYELSYTIQSALNSALATTSTGFARASTTEYLAGSIGHLVTTPTPEFANYVGKSMVSAVPEPSSWLMTLAGLIGIGFSVRRRMSRAAD